jgi:hypothetical protein
MSFLQEIRNLKIALKHDAKIFGSSWRTMFKTQWDAETEAIVNKFIEHLDTGCARCLWLYKQNGDGTDYVRSDHGTSNN